MIAAVAAAAHAPPPAPPPAGMTPDGVIAMQPGFFSTYFYLLAQREPVRRDYGYRRRPQMVRPPAPGRSDGAVKAARGASAGVGRSRLPRAERRRLLRAAAATAGCR